METTWKIAASVPQNLAALPIIEKKALEPKCQREKT